MAMLKKGNSRWGKRKPMQWKMYKEKGVERVNGFTEGVGETE